MRRLLFYLLCPLVLFSQAKLDEVAVLLEQKDYIKAEEVLRDFLKTAPNNLKGLELLGDVYGYQKKWDDALIPYKTLLDIKPNTANYHYKYGGVLGMKALQNKIKAIGYVGDIKEAFTRAAELDETHIEARWALVEFYIQLPGIIGGSVSKSLEYAEELEHLSPVDGYLAKGYIYEYDDEPELAEAFYKKAIKIGGSLSCYNKLTKLYESENEPKKAILNIEEAQKKHKRNALHYQIGKVAAEYRVELEKGEQCLFTYLNNFSIKDGVPKAWAHYRLAQINYHKKNKEKALKFIDLAILALPEVKPFKIQKDKILNL